MKIRQPTARGLMISLGIILLPAKVVPVAGYEYTAFDDASWAISSTNLSATLLNRRHVYDAQIAGCKQQAGPARSHVSCALAEKLRLERLRGQPPSMKNFTAVGFEKRTAPTEAMRLLFEFYHRYKSNGTVEFRSTDTLQNTWEVNTTLISLVESRRYAPMGGRKFIQNISRHFQPIMEGWSSQKLRFSAMFGIRVYHNRSVFAPHVDRLANVIGAVINVDQDVDEDWPLEIYDHDGVAHNVTLQPGEMVLYEAHTCIHGRPFPLRGSRYANAFLHFEPIGMDDDLPSYILPGSYTAKKLHNISSVIEIDDVLTLRYMFVDLKWRDIFHEPIDNETLWRPIHEACRMRHLDSVKFLHQKPRVDMNAVCLLDNVPTTPLTIAKRAAIRDHYEVSGKRCMDDGSCDDVLYRDEIVQFLKAKRAVEATATERAASKARRAVEAIPEDETCSGGDHRTSGLESET